MRNLYNESSDLFGEENVEGIQWRIVYNKSPFQSDWAFIDYNY